MKTSNLKIARRYAKALFDSCQPVDLESVSSLLADFAKIWEANLDLREALLYPATPLDKRLGVLQALGEIHFKSYPVVSSFLSLLLRNKRISAVPQIAKCFSDLIDQFRRLLTLEVTSAFELATEEKSGIQQKIQAEYGGMASLNWKVDSALIGGLRIKAGDMVLDGSLQGSLDRMRNQMDFK